MVASQSIYALLSRTTKIAAIARAMKDAPVAKLTDGLSSSWLVFVLVELEAPAEIPKSS